MTVESRFQAALIEEIRKLFPWAIVLKNDPNYLQGFPDLLVLNDDRWAALETKRTIDSERQPNQEYYVDLLSSMSYASFIYPQNKGIVLNELQQTFRPVRSTRLFRR